MAPRSTAATESRIVSRKDAKDAKDKRENSKHEIRSSKQFQMTKRPNISNNAIWTLHSSLFQILKLFRISIFEFRD
jgi:hypothetical protein